MTIDRELLLIKKREQLLSELSAWAEEEKLLRPGEQIFFTMKITSVATIATQGGVGILASEIPDFFTEERCARFSDDPNLRTRIIAGYYGWYREEEGPGEFLTTVEDMLRANFRPVRPNQVGKKTADAIKKMLEEEGITL